MCKLKKIITKFCGSTKFLTYFSSSCWRCFTNSASQNAAFSRKKKHSLNIIYFSQKLVET